MKLLRPLAGYTLHDHKTNEVIETSGRLHPSRPQRKWSYWDLWHATSFKTTKKMKLLRPLACYILHDHKTNEVIETSGRLHPSWPQNKWSYRDLWQATPFMTTKQIKLWDLWLATSFMTTKQLKLLRPLAGYTLHDHKTNKVIETSGRLHPSWPQKKRLHTPRTTEHRHIRQDRRIQTELASTLAKNATTPNPFKIIQLQTTGKENNWQTEETSARAAVTLQTEWIKGSNPWCLWWWSL